MREVFQPAVYIVTNCREGVLYIGVTSNIVNRMHQHRTGSVAGFTSKYRLKRLVLVEYFGTMELAIAREKQLKRWHREWKLNLVAQCNPDWVDLAVEQLGLDPVGVAGDAETSSA